MLCLCAERYNASCACESINVFISDVDVSVRSLYRILCSICSSAINFPSEVKIEQRSKLTEPALKLSYLLSLRIKYKSIPK